MSGPKLAALYGLIPNKLGFCGPKQELLKKFILGKLSIPEIIPTLEKFEAAYAYYQLIARKNKISDPFNKKVVEAYWLGNELLDKFTADDLRHFIIERLCQPGLLSPKEAAKRAALVPAGSKPHHSFHVMILGSITGSVDFTGNTKLKDVCRVGWGRVVSICHPELALPRRSLGGGWDSGSRSRNEFGMTKNKIIVSYAPLIGKKNLEFGKPKRKEIIWDKDLLESIEIGEWVSFHWGYAIQTLNEEDIFNLYKYTQNTLDSLNS